MVGGFSEGSDHVVWAEGSWRIPVIYLADWPDRYIHTQKDIPANLDSTKMKRAMFIAAAAGWSLANVDQAQVPALEHAMKAEMLERRAAFYRKNSDMRGSESYLISMETDDAASLARFGLKSNTLPPPAISTMGSGPDGPGSELGAPVVTYHRKDQPKGPMDGFGYSWLDDRLKQAGLPRPSLLDRAAPRDGPSFAYEALNLVNGKRSVADIVHFLTLTVAPVPTSEVMDYLATLEKLGLLEKL